MSLIRNISDVEFPSLWFQQEEEQCASEAGRGHAEFPLSHEVNEIQPSSRRIFPLTLVGEISYVFIQYYANAAICTPAIQSVACVPPPLETINTLSPIWLYPTGFVWMCVDVCIFCLRASVHSVFVCVDERLNVRVEVETAFGFGALLRREKKKKKKYRKIKKIRHK